MEQQTQFRHLKMQVQRKLNACLQKSERFFDRTFTAPTVTYEVRGLKAGVAYLQKNTIKFNRTLLLENPTEFVNQVVPHELAHLIVYQLFGRVKPHGEEWRTVMTKVFQLPAETCHRFDVTSVRGKTFAYRCGCRLHRLSVRRHNKIQREHAVYLCQICQKRLVPADEIYP